MAAQVLSFLNFKGGVGKTTTAVNLGAILALHPQVGGRRVLIVDLDPQCNSTLWLMGREGYAWVQQRGQTIHELYHQHLAGAQPDPLPLIHPVDTQELTGGRLDLLAGSFSCLQLEEDRRILDDAPANHLVLARSLEPILDSYDLILLDCPPSWSVLTRNALRASRHVLIPYTPDYLALEGILWMRDLHAAFEERVGAGNIARLTGIIVNRVRSAPDNPYIAPHMVALNELAAVIDGLQQKHGYRLHVFQPFIAESTAVFEALNDQQTLLRSNPDHPSTRQFVGLAAEITGLLRRIDAQTPAPREPHALVT